MIKEDDLAVQESQVVIFGKPNDLLRVDRLA